MRKILLAAVIALMFSCTEKPPKFNAPLFDNLGTYEMKISTKNKWCQKFFNQGLALTYGFNHAEAYRAYVEAARLDSNCAMCYWGAALVNGPNINAPMADTSYAGTYAFVQKALSKLEYANEKEKAMINALAKRYPTAEPTENRSQHDMDYANAMREVLKQFPEDDDIATMTGEALMDLHPWDFWLKDGSPQEWTPEIVDIFEKVLARNEKHPGANHYYIHAVEASKTADRALPCADRLGGLIPGAGHLVHMPAHIYIRLGKYHDASRVNEDAIASDSSYFAQCHAQGFYPAAYATHNVHFLFITAAFEGRSKDAIAAAQHVTHKMMDSIKLFYDPMWGPTMQHFSVMELVAYTRFAKWDEILNYHQPDTAFHFATAMWHYARGYAQIGKGNIPEAEKEIALLGIEAAVTTYKEALIFGINNQYNILNVGYNLLMGELQAKNGKTEEAKNYFTKAAEFEDILNYNEPPDWFFPVRNAWGAALMEAGQYAEAEKILRDDLVYNLNDPWSLRGLYECLEKLGKTSEAAKAKAEFEEQWRYADFELKGARIL